MERETARAASRKRATMGLGVRCLRVTAMIGQFRDGRSTGSILSCRLPRNNRTDQGNVVTQLPAAAMLARRCTDSVFMWGLGGRKPRDRKSTRLNFSHA